MKQNPTQKSQLWSFRRNKCAINDISGCTDFGESAAKAQINRTQKHMFETQAWISQFCHQNKELNALIELELIIISSHKLPMTSSAKFTNQLYHPQRNNHANQASAPSFTRKFADCIQPDSSQVQGYTPCKTRLLRFPACFTLAAKGDHIRPKTPCSNTVCVAYRLKHLEGSPKSTKQGIGAVWMPFKHRKYSGTRGK